MPLERAWTWALALTAAVTLIRVALLFVTPLQLYPDEAQYWLWAQTPAWGYASKPPVIAWLIWLTTRLGDGEALVRLSAPLLHGATALALFWAARRIYGAAEALLACLLWLLTPAVLASSVIIATDAPMMLGLALALWAYGCLLDARSGSERLAAAGALGLALGFAALSKQAAIYFLIGLVVDAVLRTEARRAWRGWAWAAALGVFALIISPNLVWQAQHHFATFAHTAQVNAGVGSAHHLRPAGPLAFLAAQFGVLGPIPLIILLVGTVSGALTGSLRPQDRMLLSFALPPLAIMFVFAAFADVEANWGAAGYGAAVVLVSGWLLRRRARGWLAATVGLQGALAVLSIALLVRPQIVDAVSQGASLKRMRGWDVTAAFASDAAQQAVPLTAVVVEDRSLFNELAYYGRRTLRAPHAPPLRMRPPQGRVLNQAQLQSPLKPGEDQRVLVLEMTTPDPPKLPAEFTTIRPLAAHSVHLDPKHSRELRAWLGEGYRGPVSARPS